MTEPPSLKSVSDDETALERFVMENDDLLTLEEHIGRFNIFDALRIVEKEVKHSEFLAWLIDPNESHGQGGLFLRAVLMDALKTARADGFACPISPIELDGEDLRGVEVRREWRNIDLLVRCDRPRFVLAIENKIRSGEHDDQLARYRRTLETEFPGVPSLYVFLTIRGDEATEPDWVAYSYGHLHRALMRVRNVHESSIGRDVLAFLDHYLRLIRGRLMDDPTIVELCRRIYKNHRRALDLIYEHAGSPASGLVAEIVDAVAGHPGGWAVINTTSKQVVFVPTAWSDLLPKIGSRPKFQPNQWVVLRFEVRKTKAFFSATVWPTSDPELRKNVIRRLTRNPKEFRFRLMFKTSGDAFTQLGRETIDTWAEGDGPDGERVLGKVRHKLDELQSRLAGVPAALEPLFGGTGTTPSST